jgi:drug/metabolite transporter (DMT)-like permease
VSSVRINIRPHRELIHLFMIMNDILTTIILFSGLVVLLLPFTYLWHFFMDYIPRRYGYFKFGLIVFCYLSLMALSTFLISKGMIGVIIFLTIPIINLLIGALFFKEEIKHELKWDLKGVVDNNEVSHYRRS